MNFGFLKGLGGTPNDSVWNSARNNSQGFALPVVNPSFSSSTSSQAQSVWRNPFMTGGGQSQSLLGQSMFGPQNNHQFTASSFFQPFTQTAPRSPLGGSFGGGFLAQNGFNGTVNSGFGLGPNSGFGFGFGGGFPGLGGNFGQPSRGLGAPGLGAPGLGAATFPTQRSGASAYFEQLGQNSIWRAQLGNNPAQGGLPGLQNFNGSQVTNFPNGASTMFQAWQPIGQPKFPVGQQTSFAGGKQANFPVGQQTSFPAGQQTNFAGKQQTNFGGGLGTSPHPTPPPPVKTPTPPVIPLHPITPNLDPVNGFGSDPAPPTPPPAPKPEPDPSTGFIPVPLPPAPKPEPDPSVGYAPVPVPPAPAPANISQIQIERLHLLRSVAQKGSASANDKAKMVEAYMDFRLDEPTVIELHQIASSVAAEAFSYPSFATAANDWNKPGFNRTGALNDLVAIMNAQLGMNVSVEFFNSPAVNGKIQHGFYSPATDTINLNTDNEATKSFALGIKTVFHEMLHALHFNRTKHLGLDEVVEKVITGKMSYTDAMAYFNLRQGNYLSASEVTQLQYEMNPHEQIAFIGQHLFEEELSRHNVPDSHRTLSPNHPLLQHLRQLGLA